jgi:hypothetical protein
LFAIRDTSQTVLECVLIAWWAGFAAYPCHFGLSIADDGKFFL